MDYKYIVLSIRKYIKIHISKFERMNKNNICVCDMNNRRKFNDYRMPLFDNILD